MKSILIVFLALISLINKSQTKVGYAYDLNGNRIQRYFIGLKPPRDNDANPLDSAAISQGDPGQIFADSKQVAAKYGIDVYPNPTKDLVMITFNKEGIDSKSIRATIYLVDISGRQIEEKKYTGSEISFDLSGMPAGSYSMKILFKNEEAAYYQVIKVN
jgi:hypothetical protein